MLNQNSGKTGWIWQIFSHDWLSRVRSNLRGVNLAELIVDLVKIGPILTRID